MSRVRAPLRSAPLINENAGLNHHFVALCADRYIELVGHPLGRLWIARLRKLQHPWANALTAAYNHCLYPIMLPGYARPVVRAGYWIWHESVYYGRPVEERLPLGPLGPELFGNPVHYCDCASAFYQLIDAYNRLPEDAQNSYLTRCCIRRCAAPGSREFP